MKVEIGISGPHAEEAQEGRFGSIYGGIVGVAVALVVGELVLLAPRNVLGIFAVAGLDRQMVHTGSVGGLPVAIPLSVCFRRLLALYSL